MAMMSLKKNGKYWITLSTASCAGDYIIYGSDANPLPEFTKALYLGSNMTAENPGGTVSEDAGDWSPDWEWDAAFEFDYTGAGAFGTLGCRSNR